MTVPADRVLIEGLRIPATIGVYEWERHIRQTLVVDLALAIDTAAAGASDALADALDYAALATRVTEFVQAAEAQLIERLANGIAALALDDPRVAQVEVTVRKPGAVPSAAAVGVSVVRRQAEPA